MTLEMIDPIQEVEKRRAESLRWKKAASVAQADGQTVRAAELASNARSLELEALEQELPAVPPPVVAGEVVPTEEQLPDLQGGWAIRNTLAAPDVSAIAASLDRTALLSQPHVDVLAIGVDAAASAGGNSLEKMLAHQLALAHKAAFKLMDRAMGERDVAQMARLVNAASRMILVYQQGLLALHRIRTGGKQTVTVQHVNVSHGGQALVAGAMQTRGPAAATVAVGS